MLQVHAQSFAFTAPCEEYEACAGSVFEQLTQEPGLTPAQLPRYWPAAQSAAHELQAYPLPSAWLQMPVRYSLAEHVWLSHAKHAPALW